MPALKQTSSKLSPAAQNEKALVELIGSFSQDPLGYVMACWPWGVAGGPLATKAGPRKWQAEVLDGIGRQLRSGCVARGEVIRRAISSGHGIGKLHCQSLVVNTPSGPRVWGDLAPGDLVFGQSGAPTKVLQTHRYNAVPMMRVTFDDRSYTDVSTGHLWNVRGRQERRKGIVGWRTLETIQIANLGVKRSNGKAEARQWEIPIQGSAQFEERPVPLHPYVLGVWLGDGTKGAPAYTKPFEEVRLKVESCGFRVTTRPDGRHQHIVGSSALFKGGVFELGSHERYIPDDYKYNTVANRMALFEGVCDTDGEVHASGSIGYSTTSLRLAEDFLWLARSLGCKAYMQPTIKKTWYPDEVGARIECRDCYRVTVNAPFNPFTIKHRRDAYKPSCARFLTRWIESIEPLPNADGMCISVEAEDGLYLANDFIVTHNSALMSMIIKWSMDTCVNARVTVTAMTETQLRTKTWNELHKWHNMSLTKHWCKATATALYRDDPSAILNWRADAIPWSETSTEGFAGLHNHGRRLVLLFDEASGISEKLWEAASGATTGEDTEVIWIVLGNPTRNTGKFYSAFHGPEAPSWNGMTVDSRDVEGTNKAELQRMVDTYGENSDYVRVRVRGMFPSVGDTQLISSDLVNTAMSRIATNYERFGKVLGVDVARQGTDKTVFCFRQGQHVGKFSRHSIPDIMQIAARVAEAINLYKPHSTFVDATGMGWGVVDRLRQLGFQNVQAIQTGEKAFDQTRFYMRRDELWITMKEWLEAGGCLPRDPELERELTNVNYWFNAKNQYIIESKDDMKARGLMSPDAADALCLTFAMPVAVSATDESTAWRDRFMQASNLRRSPMTS